MTTPSFETAKATVTDAIATIAPEVADEVVDVDPDVDVWEYLGLDSMDHLNLMTELAERTGVEIPERDYGGLRSIDAIARYLAAATTTT